MSDNDQNKTPVTASTKPTQPVTSKKSKGAGFAIFLAFIAIALAAAASAYGWQQLQLLKQDIAGQVKQPSADQQFDTFKQNMAKRLDSFIDQQHVLQGKLDTLESAISASASNANRDQRGWVLAEAAYLMNMANARLRLLRDVDSAIEALKGADQRIASLADPALFPVQEALAEEISNLQAMGTMDSNGVALKLINLGKLVRKMPPAQVILGSEKAAADAEASALLATLFNKIGLQKNQRTFDARPTQVDILNMDQKILLDLDAARHAVLRFDPKTYAAHISAALQTLEQHYDKDNAQVQTVAQELRTISSRNIFPALPDISGSSSLLNTARNQYNAAAPAMDKEQTL